MTTTTDTAGSGLPEWTLVPISAIRTLADKDELTGEAKAIQEVLDRYAQGTVERNLQQIESCFVTTDDFLIIESSYPNFGWDDYKNNHLLPELETIDDLAYRADIIQAYATERLAYAVFKYKASGAREGQRRTFEGLGTAVLVPTTDGWRIRHWATCSRRPPAHSHG